MKKRQIEFALLGILLLGVALVVYYDVYHPAVTPGVLSAAETYTPIGVQDPSLRLDLLQKIRTFEYSGIHRNIFSATLPPPVTPAGHGSGLPSGPAIPQEPPLVIPVKFFGYSVDTGSGKRRAFFTDGDDVFIAAEGEMLLNRFRILHIGNASAELEEVSSGRRATVILEEETPAP